MAEFAGPALEIGKCIVEPIKRQFNFLCCFNSNIQDLRDQAKKLDDAMVGVEGQVDVARRNIEVIVPEVVSWLDNVDKIQENYMNEIEPTIQNVKSGCLAINSRFSLSRKATKMATAMKQLQDDGKFGQISHPAPPAAMASIPLGQNYELQSRKHVEEDIIETLRENKVSMIGIFGMGGVGKTTMAKKIMSRVRGEGLFDEIVMAVVSQPVDMFRLQKEIAELLGLKLEVESLAARAHLLRVRLMNTKSILIILDDLWKRLNLEDLGIPHQRELKECTILLTSRNKEVFSAMSVEKTFQMKTLEAAEAWSLFKEKVGVCADDPSLFPTAQEILQECKGLPIALVTVGVALKDKTNKFIWANAVQELRNCNPQDIPDFLAQVYNPLKLSYDLLESEQARSIFLLCCLFPEDYDIRISNLILYACGLRLFEGNINLQVTKNKVQTLVEMLKCRSLLLEGRDDGFTKMHDVVRDVGIFIAAKEGLIDLNLSWKSWPIEETNYNIDCTWVYLFVTGKIMLPKGLVFSNLRFLLIEGTYKEGLPLCDNLFESTRAIYVLSITMYRTMRFLPHTIQLLKNLRTLVLYMCSSLEDISIVGELVSLEILYCYNCPLVKELPVEIGRLNQLKLLDISYCWSLSTIAAGVLSRLIRLEELTLINSFRKWELSVEEGKNAALCELNSLPSLTTLRIEVQDASLAAEQIHLPNLEEFDITIGNPISMLFNTPTRYGREMKLQLERDVIVGDWIHQLVRTTESLLLRGEGLSKLVPLLPEFQSLKRLKFQNAKMTRLINGRSSGITTVFPVLEFLTLQDIDDLQEIHKGPISSDSFKNLKEIRLSSLPKLQYLWNMVPLFRNLSSIYIAECCNLRSLFLWTTEQRVLRESMQFPRLYKMKIMKCPNLKSLVSLTKNDHKEGSGSIKHGDDDTLHLFCEPKDAIYMLEKLVIDGYDSISSLWCDQIRINFFTGLEVLKVKNCDNIKSIFSFSIAKNLFNLIELSIESCCEMVKVIEDKVGEIERTPFIKLKVLRLIQLPKLKTFCDWRYALELPSLKKVFISKCPLMERFPFGVLTSPISSDSFKNLESIEIGSCSMLEQVVLWNEGENGEDINQRINFPKLKKVLLHDLPRFTSFCKGFQSIEFPLLTILEIMKCKNMKSLVRSTTNDHTCSGAINHDADDSLHLFCKSEAALGSLKELKIDGYESIRSEIPGLWCDQISMDFFTGLVDLTVRNCGNIKGLFSLSIAENLPNLSRLSIRSCHEIVKVVENKDDEVESSPFIKLNTLTLEKLPKLIFFCDWRCALHFPSLRIVDIHECPQMEAFSSGSLTSPNLERIIIDRESIRNTQDINDALFARFPSP